MAMIVSNIIILITIFLALYSYLFRCFIIILYEVLVYPIKNVDFLDVLFREIISIPNCAVASCLVNDCWRAILEKKMHHRRNEGARIGGTAR